MTKTYTIPELSFIEKSIETPIGIYWLTESCELTFWPSGNSDGEINLGSWPSEHAAEDAANLHFRAMLTGTSNFPLVEVE